MSSATYNTRENITGITVVDYDQPEDARLVKETFERVWKELEGENRTIFHRNGEELRFRDNLGRHLIENDSIVFDKAFYDVRREAKELIDSYKTEEV